MLRDGDKSGKVALGVATKDGSTVGLGALEGLMGEIAVLDGEAWISRVEPGGRVTTERAAHGEQAALLFLARVPAWRERELKRDLDFVQVEPFLKSFASAAKLDALDAFPFVIRGRVEALQSHVLAGRCPYNSADTSGAEPVRERHAAAQATLVGLYSNLPPGELTHHGSRLHVHVLIEDPTGAVTRVAHVDSVRIPKGAMVQVPRRPQPAGEGSAGSGP